MNNYYGAAQSYPGGAGTGKQYRYPTPRGQAHSYPAMGTTLVARRGYSGMGAEDKKEDGGGFFGWLKDTAGKVWTGVSSGEKAKGRAESYQQQLAYQQQQQMPPWLLPVAIGGVVLFLVLKKK